MDDNNNYRQEAVNFVKIGDYIIIGNEPCRVTELHKSRTGRKALRKLRLVGEGLFSGSTQHSLKLITAKLKVPILTRHDCTVRSSRTTPVAHLIDQII